MDLADLLSVPKGADTHFCFQDAQNQACMEWRAQVRYPNQHQQCESEHLLQSGL